MLLQPSVQWETIAQPKQNKVLATILLHTIRGESSISRGLVTRAAARSPWRTTIVFSMLLVSLKLNTMQSCTQSKLRIRWASCSS